ncbi:hypothetical protein ACLMJK_007152 [Lecanora helva]
MSDNPASPLLRGASNEQRRPSRLSSHKSKASTRSKHSDHAKDIEECTPLLSRRDQGGYVGTPTYDGSNSPAASSLRSLQSANSLKGKKSTRWPTIIALTILGIVVVVILCLGFAAPAVVEEYAKQALVFEPTDLSIDSFTSTGVKARIQGDFMLDGSKVEKKSVRDLGRASTWIAKAVESRRSKVQIYLPEYDDLLLGTASIPPVVANIRDGHTTHINLISDLEAGDRDGIRRMAMDWVDGRLGHLSVRGVANVPLKSGIFSLGTQTLVQSMTLSSKLPLGTVGNTPRVRYQLLNRSMPENDIPSLPQYNITKLNFHEVKLPNAEKGMEADVSLELANDYPVTFNVPPLGFDVLVPGCDPGQPHIRLADAMTEEVKVVSRHSVSVQVGGFVHKVPEGLLALCPQTQKSPLDALLGDYIRGDQTTIFVRGANAPSGETPGWVTELIKSVTLPVAFPGKTFEGLIRNFSLADVHFSLPNPVASPDSPEASPRISAIVRVVAGLPKEMDFPIDVPRVRAAADVLYHEKKLGFFDLQRWQKANSSRIEAHGDIPATLAVDSIVKNAPLKITDDDVFSDLVQDLVFGGEKVFLGVEANVDIETETALGKFVVRDIPAKGKISVKPISGGDLAGFSPQVGSLRILDTTKSTLSFKAKVNVTNPTEYSATVPYMNIKLSSNGTEIGHCTARNVSVVPGANHNIDIEALWDPLTPSGKKGVAQGAELLSQYISGLNTTITLTTHADSIPHNPSLGLALSRFPISIPTPHLHPPKNPSRDPSDQPSDRDPNAPAFIDDATFHLLTSTATFTLLSPLPHSTITIDYLNATAFYNHTEPVGKILYELPWEVPPGVSTSPRLPVEWSLGGVGYQAVKEAVGGRLKLDARAEVGVGVGQWGVRVWFLGKGVGAGVSL